MCCLKHQPQWPASRVFTTNDNSYFCLKEISISLVSWLNSRRATLSQKGALYFHCVYARAIKSDLCGCLFKKEENQLGSALAEKFWSSWIKESIFIFLSFLSVAANINLSFPSIHVRRLRYFFIDSLSFRKV